jgi:hypothetical protein
MDQQLLLDVYSNIHHQITNRWKRKLLPKEEGILKKFPLLLKKYKIYAQASGILFFEKYVTYVYCQRLSHEEEFIGIIKIFGKGGVEIFNDRKENWVEKLEFFREKYKIKKIDIKKDLIQVEDEFDSEEVYRKRFFNSDRGFVTCIENTSLINPKSKFCSKCVHSKHCLVLLKANFKAIYKNRYGVK